MAQKIEVSKIFSINKSMHILGCLRSPHISIPKNTICKSCQFGKKTRSHFIEKEGSASKPLELVHTNLCGPSRKKSLRGEE